jgi:hypothetical protein
MQALDAEEPAAAAAAGRPFSVPATVDTKFAVFAALRAYGVC